MNIKNIINLLGAVIFFTFLGFNTFKAYKNLTHELVHKLSIGIPPLSPFTEKLTRKKFDWEILKNKTK